MENYTAHLMLYCAEKIDPSYGYYDSYDAARHTLLPGVQYGTVHGFPQNKAMSKAELTQEFHSSMWWSCIRALPRHWRTK